MKDYLDNYAVNQIDLLMWFFFVDHYFEQLDITEKFSKMMWDWFLRLIKVLINSAFNNNTVRFKEVGSDFLTTKSLLNLIFDLYFRLILLCMITSIKAIVEILRIKTFWARYVMASVFVIVVACLKQNF